MQHLPPGWTPAKLAALASLLDTASALEKLTNLTAAAGDNSAAVARLKADLLALGRDQLKTLKTL